MTAEPARGWTLSVAPISRPRLGGSGVSAAGSPMAALRGAFEAGAAQVVFLPLETFRGDLAPLRALLSEDERARAARFADPAVATRFVAGRWLMRSALAAALDMLPEQLRFTYGEHGKPFLAQAPATDPAFSLTHTAGLAGFALLRGGRVGLDIEATRRLSDGERLAARIFSAAELTRFAAVPREAQVAVLLDAWVRKEAVLKALGTGISAGMDSVEVLTEAEEQEAGAMAASTVGGKSENWSIHRLPMPPGFHAALAVEGAMRHVRVWQAAFTSSGE